MIEQSAPIDGWITGEKGGERAVGKTWAEMRQTAAFQTVFFYVPDFPL